MIGEVATNIMNNGLTAAKIVEVDPSAVDDLVGRIFYGNLEEQEDYPAVQVTDFMVPEDCKDGVRRETHTVTALVWATKRKQVNNIIEEVRKDLDRKRGKYLGRMLSGSRLIAVGPWIREEQKNLWGRPVDFEMYMHKE